MNFDTYWKEFGKYHQEVIDNPRELEEDFRKLAFKIYSDALQDLELEKQQSYNNGYDNGKMSLE